MAFGGVATESSLKGLPAVGPAVVAEGLSASAAKPIVLMSAAKLRPPTVVDRPKNNRQTPFIPVRAIFMFSPLN
jgi:hypothetical protein